MWSEIEKAAKAVREAAGALERSIPFSIHDAPSQTLARDFAKGEDVGARITIYRATIF